MRTNYVAAYGPDGPLYLAKTTRKDRWKVINGGYILDYKKGNKRYVIVQDNYPAQNPTIACRIIEAMYQHNKLPYIELKSDNLSVYQTGCDNTAHLKQQQFEKDPHKSIQQFEKGLPKQVNININETELRARKGFIAKEFDIKEFNIKPWEKSMNTEINTKIVTTETVHLVNDTDVKHMTNDELINAVVQLENSIEKLKAIKSKSSFINKQVKKQKKTLAVVLKHLNKRG